MSRKYLEGGEGEKEERGVVRGGLLVALGVRKWLSDQIYHDLDHLVGPVLLLAVTPALRKRKHFFE